MRNYLLEDIYEEDLVKITDALKELGFAGPIEDIFYLPIPEHLLDDIQKEHFDECGSYFMALEVLENGLKIELLVRAKGRIRCDCVRYATNAQRNYMLDYMDKFIADLKIHL
ncbi:hypothetical protein [Maridesulfovibrio hydrothermalis]|uniref:Uncharacterized protein n=1 Tax=Maridesulfovibrio hydrothermalis AM13 = DSM 14728 TaxID=1121451 RepID=L0REB8_9BACT|nr:hypothetical protein [Maridesulfovibrio hydrothermalis]CCO24552.1 conserved protein of unknown function [Maridesulfovibrio hydrothermalis AM13 = DSM 14728]